MNYDILSILHEENYATTHDLMEELDLTIEEMMVDLQELRDAKRIVQLDNGSWRLCKTRLNWNEGFR
jgi:DeoR/GlpR family transcriptional regulator of sugar metabolism